MYLWEARFSSVVNQNNLSQQIKCRSNYKKTVVFYHQRDLLNVNTIKKTGKLFFIIMLHTSAGFVIAILKLVNNIKNILF